MSSTAALVFALLAAALIVAAFRKPVRSLFSGILSRDRKGRMTLTLSPTPRKRPKRRRRK